MQPGSSLLRISFVVGILVIFAVPALRLLGVKDEARLAGCETDLPCPEIHRGAYFDRRLRQECEAWYAQKFFPRTSACRFRHLIYSLLNGYAMCDQSGTANGIASLADGALIEKYYLLPYLSGQEVNAKGIEPALETVADIVRLLRRQGVAVMFILAPDKTQLYPAGLSWFSSLFWRKRRSAPQPEFERILQRHGIPTLDAYAHLSGKRNDYAETMFPYAGVHWNALAASLVAEEAVRRINETQEPLGRFRINPFQNVSPVPRPEYGDDDLGDLLNLPLNPFLAKNIRYVPNFKYPDFAANPGSVMIWGDSFLAHIWFSLVRSGMFAPSRVLACDKRRVTMNELKSFVSDLKLVLFVYQPPHMFSLEEKFGGMLRDLASGLRQLLEEDDKDIRPFRDFSFSEKDLPIWANAHLLAAEDWGRWSAGPVRFTFATPTAAGDGMRFRVRVRACTGPLTANVLCDGEKVAHWTVSSFEPEDREFTITGKHPGEIVRLCIEQSGEARPCDVIPGSPDARTLGIGFVSMKLIKNSQ